MKHCKPLVIPLVPTERKGNEAFDAAMEANPPKMVILFRTKKARKNFMFYSELNNVEKIKAMFKRGSAIKVTA